MNSEFSMDQVLIEKLTKILQVNLDKEHFGVKELASEAGLNRSQLHRKLQSIKGKSASCFIREFRLEKAMVMLQNNVGTASEIAYRVGFSSPTYFNTCFHEYYGYPPGEAKIRNSSGASQNEDEPDLELFNGAPTISKKTFAKKYALGKRMVWINTFLIILLSVITYSLYQNYKAYFLNEPAIPDDYEGSVAILPFKNLSEAKEDEFFTMGVRTSLQNQLNTIKSLKVISSNSMEKYTNTEMSPSEIADEIGVTYLLDGSVQKYVDSIKIIINFINARKNHQLSSLVYIEKFNNLFALQSKIAKQVAEKIKGTLSPSEIEQIEKKSTDNLQAYRLYLNGRFFWNQRTEKDLNKSLYYFDKALELDSTYALAYAGLADTYYIMAWWGWYPKNEGFNKGKEYAMKAIAIDNNITEAHTTLGGTLTFHDWNWIEAEKEFKLAISLNPNYDNAHHYYYELLDVLCRNEEARIQLDLALELNPYSLIMNRQSAYSYYKTENYKRAIDVFNKAIDLEAGNDMLIYPDKLSIIKCYIHLGWDELAIDTIKKFVSTDPSIDNKILDNIYHKSGIDGLVFCFINWMFEHTSEKHINDIMIASFYSIIGDSQNALKLLEKAFEEGDSELPFIKNNPDFNSIKTEPRFIALLEKMGLDD